MTGQVIDLRRTSFLQKLRECGDVEQARLVVNLSWEEITGLTVKDTVFVHAMTDALNSYMLTTQDPLRYHNPGVGYECCA